MFLVGCGPSPAQEWFGKADKFSRFLFSCLTLLESSSGPSELYLHLEALIRQGQGSLLRPFGNYYF